MRIFAAALPRACSGPQRLLFALLFLATAAGLICAPAPAKAESLAEARQRMLTAQTRLDTAKHRVVSRRGRLAAANAAVAAHLAAAADARRTLRVLLRRLAPAQRRTAAAGQALAAANVTLTQAQRNAAAATAELQRAARNAYMNASSASELTMLLGFASDGPSGLSDLAHRNLAVDRIETRSVSDMRTAADLAAAAATNAQAELARYQTIAAREGRVAQQVRRAREVLVNELTALREARGKVDRLSAALARAQREHLRARAALRQAAAAYRRALRKAPDGIVTPPAPISPGSSAQYVWDTLRCNGFTEQASAGILGNLQQESGINPTTIQNGGPGMGLAQWSRGGRWDNGPNSLLAFAAARNLDPWDAATQTRFMIYEMQLGWGGFDLAGFKAMTDVLAATIYFHDVYERSADSSGFVTAVRGGYAMQWFARLAGRAPRC